MKLVKYESPANPIDRLFDRLNWGFPMIDRYLNDETGGEEWDSVRLPRTNVHETPDAFIFTMEMPGLDKKDVSVNIEGDVLIVKGEKEEKHEEKGLIRREYRSTRFERTFNVNGVDRESVRAKMDHGILSITLPKSPEKVGKKIEIV
ncbi:MAG TPA: Hsp20/alpha crystallin family protein [Candidatus Krumholzibacteria bacterium]|nr:Hsp20/alpha crystallin family protein [Candidatus Krumholzibacteria bacterium]